MTAAEAPATRPRSGALIVARKELADHLHSIRLLIVAALLMLSAVAAVYAASGTIRDAAPQASSDPSLFLRLFTLQVGETPFAFFTLISLLAPLLGIAFGFDALNAERSGRTLPRLLSQPIHRDAVINGKFLAGIGTIGVVLVALTGLVAAVGILRLGLVPAPGDVARLLAFALVSVLYIGFWLALSILLSVVLRRAATSALAALASWVVLGLFAGLLVSLAADLVAPAGADATAAAVLRNIEVEQALGRLSPGFLYEEITTALLTPELRTLGVIMPRQAFRTVPGQLPFAQSLLLVWPQIAGLLAMTVAAFAAAYVAFLRQEIRA